MRIFIIHSFFFGLLVKQLFHYFFFVPFTILFWVSGHCNNMWLLVVHLKFSLGSLKLCYLIPQTLLYKGGKFFGLEFSSVLLVLFYQLIHFVWEIL